MQNGEQLEKMYKTLKDSAGSADAEQARYMDSIEAKMNALRETTKGLFINSINSDDIKAILDLATNGVGAIGSLVDTFGAIPTTLTGVSMALSTFNSNFRNSYNTILNAIPGIGKLNVAFQTMVENKGNDYSQKYKDIAEEITNVKKKISELNAQQTASNTVNNSATQGISAYGRELVTLNGKLVMAKAGMIACRVATVALQTAMSFGLSVAIEAGISAITHFVNASEELKKKNQDTIDSIKSSQQDVNSLKDLKDQYNDLQTNIAKGNMTTEQASQQREKLNDKYKQLIEQIPELKGALDEENQSYKEQMGIIQQAIAIKEKQQQIDNKNYINDNDVNDKDINKQLSKIDELKEKYNQKMGDFGNKKAIYGGDSISFDFFKDSDIEKSFDKAKNKASQEMLDMQKELQEKLTQINLFEKLNGGQSPVSEETKNNIKQAIDDINKQLNEMGNVDTSKSTDAVKEMYSALDELTTKNSLSRDTILELAETFPNLGINASNASQVVSTFGNELKGNIDLLKSSMDELNANGNLGTGTIENLANAFPQLNINSENAQQILSTLFDLMSDGVGSIDDLADSVDDASTSFDKLDQEMSKVSKNFDAFNSQVGMIDKVIEEMGKYGGITRDTYGSLIKSNPEILACLMQQGDKIQNLTKLKNEDLKAMEENKNQAIQLAMQEYAEKYGFEAQTLQNKQQSDEAKLQSDTNTQQQIQQNAQNTANEQQNAYTNDTNNFNNNNESKLSSDFNFQEACRQNTIDTVNSNSAQFVNEDTNYSNLTSNKQENDSIFQNDWVNNTVNSVNSNSSNFDVEDSNYGNLTSNKSANDANFQNAWRVNTANTVNTLANHYKIDLENFKNVMQAKQQLLISFGSNLEKLGASMGKNFVFKGASIGANSTMDMMTKPWAIPDAGERQKFVEQTDKLLGFNNQLTAEFNAYQSGLNEIGNYFSNIGKQFSNSSLPDVGTDIKLVDPNSAPTMVADGGGSGSGGSKGKSGGSGSKGGKSDAEKAQEEAEKFAKQIAETNSDLKFDRYFDLNNTIKEITNSLEDNKTVRESLTDTILIQDSISQEVDLYKKKKDAIVDLKNEYVAEKEELREYLSKYSFQFDDEGQIINSQQRLKELQDSINAMGGNTQEELDNKKEWIEWLKDLSEKCKDFSDIVNDKIPDCINQFKELGNSIKKIYEENLTDLRDQLIKGIEKDISDAREKQEGIEKDIYDSQLEKKENEIKELQKQLDALNDDSDDKKKRLEKLKNELKLWKKEKNNVYAKSKIDSLNSEIQKLQIDIQKDDLQKQIDAKNEEKNKIDEDYEAQQKATKEMYDKMEEEGEKYARANKLLMEKNTTEIERLLELQSEKFKDIGRLWGQNLSDSFSSEIKGALDGIEYLKGGNGFTVNQASQSNNISKDTQVEGNNVTKQPQSWSSNWIADTGDHVWIPKPQETEVYSDTQGNGLGSAWNNGIGAGDELKVTDYDNGYVKIVNKSGQSWWIDRYKLNRWNEDISQFATGGRTPSNLPDSGALSILHKKEAILNANDTQKLDDIHEYVKSTSIILDRIDTNYNLLNNLNSTVSTIPNINPTMSRLSNITNNTTNDNSMVQEINNYFDTNITNNTKEEVMMNDRMFEQKMNKLMGKYGQNRHRR